MWAFQCCTQVKKASSIKTSAKTHAADQVLGDIIFRKIAKFLCTGVNKLPLAVVITNRVEVWMGCGQYVKFDLRIAKLGV